MITQILFTIPAMYEAAVKSGNLIQIGGLLKDAASGKIVAHLQESGLAHSLIGKTILGATSPITLAITEAASAGTGIYTAIQVNQIKQMVAGLQSLQIATLGVSLVGIGVSVAGFLYMHKRFNSLDKKIDTLIDTVTSGFDNQQKYLLRSHLSQAKGLVLQARQAPSLAKPEYEYSRIAEALAGEAAHFQGELEFVIKANDNINIELFWQLAQALMVCNSVRIDCRIRTNELYNALIVAEGVASSYQRLFEQLTPISFNTTGKESHLTIKAIKDITDSASTKPYLIDHLHTQRIDGHTYLRQLENEMERPLLMLNVA